MTTLSTRIEDSKQGKLFFVSTGESWMKDTTREAYLLAQLQPGAPGLDTIPGGRPEFTVSDISATLGMGHLPRAIELFLWLKFVGDKTVLRELDQLILTHVQQQAMLCKWRSPWPQDARKTRLFHLQLGRMALNEILDENRCSPCEGRGKTRSYHPCKRCGGTGRSFLRAAECGRWCGIDRKAWINTWQVRYLDNILPPLQDWERIGLEHVRRYLDG